MSRVYWRRRVFGVCVSTQHCAPLYVYAFMLLQTRRHGNTRLLTAATFGVDVEVEVMSPWLQCDIPNMGMSGQPAASEVDGVDKDVHIAQTQSLKTSVREHHSSVFPVI